MVSPAPGSGLESLSDEELIALLGGGGGSEIREFGGSLYRIGASGQPELLLQGPGPAGRQPQYTVDERTGQVVQMTPGAQVGFAGIDPREKYGNELQQTGFSNQMQQRAQALNELESAQANVMRMAQMAEEAKLNRAQLGESGANRAEQGRQANLRAAVDQWQTAMNLVPAMGQLSLQESERVQGILSNGGDFLARAFESRGGSSPLGRVTQADQINALGQSMQNLRNMVQTNMNPVSSQYSDTSTGIGGYEAPDLGSLGSGFGGPALPPMPQAPNLQMSPAPAPVSSAPAGAGGGGGLAAPAPAPYVPNLTPPTFNPNAPNLNPPTFDINAPGGGWSSPDEAMGASRPESSGPTGFSSRPYAPVDQLPPEVSAAISDPRIQYSGGYTGGSSGGGGGSLPSWMTNLFSSEGSQQARLPYGAYAEGGFTTEPVFLGNEKGAELFVNPTGAPIQILPADDTKQMGFSKGTMPGYDEGTSGYAMPSPVLEAEPTGGFLNSLREALGIPYTSDGFNERMQQTNQRMLESPEQFLGFGGLGKAPEALNQFGRPVGESMMAGSAGAREALSGLRAAEGTGGGFMEVLRKLIPGFATGTIIQNTGAPTPIANNQYYGQSAGLTKGATSPLAGMGGAPVPNQMNPRNDPRINQQGVLGAEFQNGFTGWGGSNPNPAGNTALQMQKSFDEASFYKKNGRMPNPGELGMNQQAYKPVTQQELIAMGRANLPPAVADVLGGKSARPMTALESQAVPGNFLKTITARQLQGLTPEEIQALGTMTNTEYNAPLSYVLGRTQAQYGPSQEMRRGFLKGAI